MLAILDQLCRKLEEMPKILLDSQNRAEEPADVSYAEFLIEVAKSFTQVFIIIDGLDECPEKERSGILKFIAQTVHTPIDKACFKMFVSSRRDADINAAFSSIRTPVIELEAGKITPDIKKFVREEALRLRATSELRIESDDLFERVIQDLIKKSDGMFLWVRLQLGQLCEESRAECDYYIEEALSILPTGLNDMYTKIFNDIAQKRPRKFKIALECFRWIRYANERIGEHFLRMALALIERPTSAEELESRMMSIDHVLEACGNLLSIDEFGEVKLIHFSVDEFLRKVLFKKPGGYWEDLADRHNADFVLACRCIDLLLLADIDSPRDNFVYAAGNFDRHVLGSIDGSADLPHGLRTRIDQLLSTDDRRLRWLLGWLAVHENEHNEPISSSWLVWATELCNIPSLETIWPNLARPKNALILAVDHYGNISVLKLLLSEGLDIHETDRKGWTALSYASYHNNQPAIDLLLQRGAIADMSQVGTGVLHLAVSSDNIDLARRLLVAGADVNELESFNCEVPLMRVKSLAMARMLCEEFKADLKINDAHGMNVLFHLDADPFDDKITAIFEYFVKQGADVTATDTIGLNILDEAVRKHWSVEKVQFLLKHYPQLVSKQEHEWTALHWACKRHHPILDNVKELVCHGVNASTITTTHPPGSWTPWDISIHYSSDWFFQECENEIHGLGGPTTSQTVALAAGDGGPSVDAAVADYNEIVNFECSLCRLDLVRFPVIERTYRTNCLTARPAIRNSA
ncbi:hypothetical protein D6D05_10490 [Aureobasidium pullulans]|nr:hypothetical protein D6D05_10490 [Aureobasidium pullulans]